MPRCTNFLTAGLGGAWVPAMAILGRSVCVEIHGILAELDKRANFKSILACDGS